MKRNRWERTIKNLAAEFGYSMAPGGKHIKLVKPNCQMVVVSRTPSDHRELRNTRSRLKRFAKGKDQ